MRTCPKPSTHPVEDDRKSNENCKAMLGKNMSTSRFVLQNNAEANGQRRLSRACNTNSFNGVRQNASLDRGSLQMPLDAPKLQYTFIKLTKPDKYDKHLALASHCFV